MRMHPASAAVTRIELFFHDVSLGHATGFLYDYGKELSLVSNWHVFAGRNPLTREASHPTGFTPNRVEFHVTEVTREKGGIGFYFAPVKAPLKSDGRPLWWQHPGYVDQLGEMQLVDIGVLPLEQHLENYAARRQGVQSFDGQVLVSRSKGSGEWSYQQGTVRVGSEIFILGYPLGLANQGVMPIWKRASVASEPLFNLEGNLPIMLVDGLTRHGMSGSPVIATGAEIMDELGRPSGLRAENDSPWLLGVYAGRRGSSAEETEMALGRVWRKQLLDEIFLHRVSGGSEPLPPI